MLTIIDSTLRDGNHAVKHKLSKTVIRDYARGAEKAGITILVVGHGNGLGASSLHLGESAVSDKIMLRTARRELTKTKLAAFAIPGFATLQDIDMAHQEGAEVLFIASHCTEATVTKQYIEYCKKKGILVYGVLMMSHMVGAEELGQQAKLMEQYGADGILLMDSAGSYLPLDIISRMYYLRDNLKIPFGFHAHNNLGLAVSNSVLAVEMGATIIDATCRGLGAGAGNCQLEVLVGLLDRMDISHGLNLYQLLDNTEIIAKVKGPQLISPLSIVSGIAGVFSGFAPHVARIAKECKVDPRDIFIELGKRRVVAGQEDQIIKVAQSLWSRFHSL